VCICDLPPAFANDDAALVAKLLDAYLLVVEQGKTTAKQIRDTMGFLEPTPCAGTILNRYVGGLAGGDYGFGYSQTAYSGYFDKPSQ
jgi:protein-tyrosine kinase